MPLKDALKRLFTRNVLITHVAGGRLKAYDVNKSQSIGSPSPYGDRGRWRTSKTFAASRGYGFGGATEDIEAIRKQMYMDYELMDTDAIISSALDLYAEEASCADFHTGEVLLIKSDDAKIKKVLHNLFYDVLNITFNLYPWMREACKYGDKILYLQIAEKFGVVNVMPIHPSLIRREEGMNDDPNVVKFFYEGDYSISHSPMSSFEAYEIAHFRLLGNSNFLPYGQSILEGSRKNYKAMSMMEDALLLHRIMRAPERRLFFIDVGNIAPEEIDAHIETIVNETKKTPYIDPETGEYNLKFNLQNSLDDIYMPVRGQQTGTKIETLAGLGNEGQLEDVKYLRQKMLAALKIPPAYLGFGEEGADTKSALSNVDVRFSKTIERIQKIFVSELYKIAVIHLYVQGFSNEDLLNFELELTNPSLIFERQKIDILTAKVDLVKSIKEDNLFSDKYIYENIFGMTEDEWQAERDMIAESAKEKFRLTQIIEEGNDPKVTGKSFGTPYDIASMQVASKLDDGSNPKSLKGLYTPDDRENNLGKPDQYAGSFETRRDQDFGRDPVGRREDSKLEHKDYSRLLKGLETKRNAMKKTLIETTLPTDGISMLDEDQLIDDLD